MRKIKFENNQYYHIYNRGVDKRDIFVDEKDFLRFMRSMREFNVIEPIGSLYEQDFRNKFVGKKLSSQLGTEFLQQRLVEIICWCLNSNHYHLIFKQLVDKGIEKFMHKLNLGYTNYFNLKYKRSGSLFQGRYKAKYLDSVGHLEGLSGYVNGNPEIHKIAKAKQYKWSSYQDYLNLRSGTLCDKKIVLEYFGNNIYEYEKFVETVIANSQERKKAIKEYLAELED